MGQLSRKSLNIRGSSTDLLGEVTPSHKILDISGPKERRLLEPHSALACVHVFQKHTQVESQALLSPLFVLPTACCRREAALPSPTSCVRPLCGLASSLRWV